MRLALVATAVLATRLALAPGATAQLAHPEPGPDPDPLKPTLPSRVEIGGALGAMLGVPEYGLLASVPIAPNAAIEVVGARMPAPHGDTPPYELGQVQVRVPFHRRLRSRRSLIVGVTAIRAVPRDRRFIGIDAGGFMGPHAGASLQWPAAPMLDVRFDAEAIVTFVRDLPTVERLTVGVVWHPPSVRPAPAGGRRP